MNNQPRRVTLVNPWTGLDTSRHLTWHEIVHWCRQNVHRSDQATWLEAAAVAFVRNDGITLGQMIISS